MHFLDQLTDFTYHLLNVMQEAEEDPNERNNLKLLTPKNYTMILVDLFFGEFHKKKTFVLMKILQFKFLVLFILLQLGLIPHGTH